jgi:hypothetical protein
MAGWEVGSEGEVMLHEKRSRQNEVKRAFELRGRMWTEKFKMGLLPAALWPWGLLSL